MPREWVKEVSADRRRRETLRNDTQNLRAQVISREETMSELVPLGQMSVPNFRVEYTTTDRIGSDSIVLWNLFK